MQLETQTRVQTLVRLTKSPNLDLAVILFYFLKVTIQLNDLFNLLCDNNGSQTTQFP